MLKTFWWSAGIILFLLFPGMVGAQTDEDDELFNDEPLASEVAIGNDVSIGGAKVVFSGSIDARLVHTGEAISWKQGGRGLTRYGGTDTDKGAERDDLGDQRTTSFELPQITLVTDVLINQQLSGFIQLNYDDHFDTLRKNGRIGVVEAYLRYERLLEGNHRLESRFGITIPPISLEHPETGWNTRYTITPSAINTWVGEEFRAIALELNYHHEFSALYSLDFMVAPFSGNDPVGSILSWRGWALHDYQLTTGSRLKTQTVVPETIVPRGEWVEPFKELDGRMGVFTKISFTRAESWSAHLFVYDNLADQTAKEYSTLEYAWRTRFTQLALEWHPTDQFTVLAQAMAGNTQMGDRPRPNVDNDFEAWYALVSFAQAGHRVSFRYDAFLVTDEDWVKTDLNDSEGIAATLAYLHTFDSSIQLGAEYLHIDSERVGAEGFDEDDDPDDDLTQFMVRVLF